MTTPIQLENISSRFASNSEAKASELLANLEEKFSRYQMYSDVFETSTTPWWGTITKIPFQIVYSESNIKLHG